MSSLALLIGCIIGRSTSLSISHLTMSKLSPSLFLFSNYSDFHLAWFSCLVSVSLPLPPLLITYFYILSEMNDWKALLYLMHPQEPTTQAWSVNKSEPSQHKLSLLQCSVQCLVLLFHFPPRLFEFRMYNKMLVILFCLIKKLCHYRQRANDNILEDTTLLFQMSEVSCIFFNTLIRVIRVSLSCFKSSNDSNY